jgi:hypothetical protein
LGTGCEFVLVPRLWYEANLRPPRNVTRIASASCCTLAQAMGNGHAGVSCVSTFAVALIRQSATTQVSSDRYLKCRRKLGKNLGGADSGQATRNSRGPHSACAVFEPLPGLWS